MNLKFILAKSKKKVWTNKAAREALGLTGTWGACGEVRITARNKSITRQVYRAPASAARIMRAVHSATGLLIVAMPQYELNELGAAPGDTCQVVNTAAVEVAPRVAASTTAKPSSLRDRIAAMKAGTQIEVSASAAKSGAYAIAKQLGVKIKKVSATMIERVS